MSSDYFGIRPTVTAIEGTTATDRTARPTDAQSVNDMTSMLTNSKLEHLYFQSITRPRPEGPGPGGAPELAGTSTQTPADTLVLAVDYIDSGQPQFDAPDTSSQDQWNSFMFGDNIRYNYETNSLQVFAERPETGELAWMNINDVSADVAQQTHAELEQILDPENQASSDEIGSDAMPANVVDFSLTELSGAVETGTGVSDSESNNASVVGTDPISNPSVSTPVDNPDGDGSVIPVTDVSDAYMHPDQQTVLSTGIDGNGNEFSMSSNPATGLSVIYDPSASEIAVIHVDPVSGQLTIVDSNGQLTEENPYLTTLGNTTGVLVENTPAAGTQVRLPDGTVVYTTYVLSDTPPDWSLYALGPDGQPIVSGGPIPPNPIVSPPAGTTNGPKPGTEDPETQPGTTTTTTTPTTLPNTPPPGTPTTTTTTTLPNTPPPGTTSGPKPGDGKPETPSTNTTPTVKPNTFPDTF